MKGRQTQSHAARRSAAARRIFSLASNPPDIDTAIMVVAERFMVDVPHPPTDLEALARRLNVSGFEAEEMPISGELRRDGNQFRVIYSSYLSSTQRRFTIAHELGHAVFAMSGPNYPRGGDEVERICDKFAAEFLMPTAEFQSKLGRELTANSILELATIFKVPLYATAIRVAEFKDLSVFTVENREVTWTYGIVRKGPFHKNNYYLRDALESVTTSPSGDITFPMSGEIALTEGRLTWISIANGNRALCLLQKSRPSRPQTWRAFGSVDELSA